jgi:hypothetical protein
MSDPPLTAADLIGRRLFQPGDLVICQKTNGPNTQSILKGLRSLGVATAYIDCDLPPRIEEARLATITVCSSSYLAEAYRKGGIGSIRYIPDAFEWSAPPKGEQRPDRLRCVWFGSTTPEKWAEVEKLRKLVSCALPKWVLVRVSDHPASEVRWALGTAWREISQADAAILPGSDVPTMLAKSSNKAVQAMALGVPVLAYPTPAYSEVIRHGRNGLLCRTEHEWISAFHMIEDPVRRRRMSVCAHRYARRAFSIERIGGAWEALLAECGLTRPTSAREEHDGAQDHDLKLLQRIVYERSIEMLRNRVRFG